MFSESPSAKFYLLLNDTVQRYRLIAMRDGESERRETDLTLPYDVQITMNSREEFAYILVGSLFVVDTLGSPLHSFNDEGYYRSPCWFDDSTIICEYSETGGVPYHTIRIHLNSGRKDTLNFPFMKGRMSVDKLHIAIDVDRMGEVLAIYDKEGMQRKLLKFATDDGRNNLIAFEWLSSNEIIYILESDGVFMYDINTDRHTKLLSHCRYERYDELSVDPEQKQLLLIKRTTSYLSEFHHIISTEIYHYNLLSKELRKVF